MKRKCTSEKVIRIPIMVPIIIWIICAIVMTTLFGKQLIMKVARYKTVEESIINNILTASDITSTDYGGYVTNYIPTNGANVGWRIFHSDGENIYLIADDYIETQYVPAGKGGTVIVADKNYTRGFSFNPYVDYAGSADISSTLLAKLLSQYTYTSKEINMKATAYFIDSNAWSGFVDARYGNYAIGAPTIELFAASYNTTHTDRMIETQVTDNGYGYGYQVKWSDESSYANFINGLDSSENLYVISNEINATGMMFASPSALTGGYMLGLGHTGAIVLHDRHGTSDGVRPIVALKSNIQLEKQEDGTYKIVEDIKIASEKYHIENPYIMKIQPNTTVETLKANIQTNATEINIYNNNQQLLTESDIVDTGMTIELKFGSQKATFTLLVIGDTNGDGQADFKDLVRINSHRLNKNKLKGEYLLAADVNGDGVANFKDIVKINKFRLHKIKEL